MDKPYFDRTDYSVVVKNRARPSKAWWWEIYRAGRSSPVKQSPINFDTMATTNRAGKEALKGLLEKPHAWSPQTSL
jgi:hypothetical protein